MLTHLTTLRRPCVKLYLRSAAVGLGGKGGLAGKYATVRNNKEAATENSENEQDLHVEDLGHRSARCITQARQDNIKQTTYKGVFQEIIRQTLCRTFRVIVLFKQHTYHGQDPYLVGYMGFL